MRRYKMTDQGEEPAWPSRAELECMGREWARHCYRHGNTLTTYGNTVHDEAAAREWAKLTAASEVRS